MTSKVLLADSFTNCLKNFASEVIITLIVLTIFFQQNYLKGTFMKKKERVWKRLKRVTQSD